MTSGPIVIWMSYMRSSVGSLLVPPTLKLWTLGRAWLRAERDTGITTCTGKRHRVAQS